MPTSTFFNLKDEKRNKIIEVVKKEFERVPLSKISIKRIVEGSYIARGSFYQYFTSKEDLIECILRQEYIRVRSVILNLLEKNNGNIFDMSYEYLEHVVENEKSKTSYYLHIAQYLKENTILLFDTIDIEDLKKNLDISILNFQSDYDLRIMLKIIAITLQMTKMDILNNNISKEDGIKRFKREIMILKKGMMKEER